MEPVPSTHVYGGRRRQSAATVSALSRLLPRLHWGQRPGQGERRRPGRREPSGGGCVMASPVSRGVRESFRLKTFKSSSIRARLHESQDVNLAQSVSCYDTPSIRRHCAGQKCVISGVGSDNLSVVKIPDQE